jgi:hypothetical protein
MAKPKVMRHYGILTMPNWVPNLNAMVVEVRATSDKEGRYGKVLSVREVGQTVDFEEAKRTVASLNDAGRSLRKLAPQARAGARKVVSNYLKLMPAANRLGRVL